MSTRPKGQFTPSESEHEAKKIEQQVKKIKEQTANIKENFSLRVRFHSVWTQLNNSKFIRTGYTTCTIVQNNITCGLQLLPATHPVLGRKLLSQRELMKNRIFCKEAKNKRKK